VASAGAASDPDGGGPVDGSGPDTVLLVHGTWHSSACWAPVVERLRGAGVPVVAPDLPSIGGPTGDDDGDFDDDVAALRAELDGHPPGSVVLVGHSRGGMVISEAGDHPAVRHLVYVAGYMAEPDEDPTGLLTDGADNLVLRGTRRDAEGAFTTFDPELAEATFYHDCPPEAVATAVAGLRRQRASFPAAPGPVLAWRRTPTTYCVCTLDRTISPDRQRLWARRVGASVEWESSHSPFLSRPDLVAGLLVERARRR
jgi:pimeloyl-ACP methyl ester carboxylesterase